MTGLRAAGLPEAHFAFGCDARVQPPNQGASVAESVAAAGRWPVALGPTDPADGHVLRGVRLPVRGARGSGSHRRVGAEVASFGVDELCLADTIGVAVPSQVRALVGRVVGLGLPVGGHFHNTRSTGYANALAALDAGARSSTRRRRSRWLPVRTARDREHRDRGSDLPLDGEGVETGVDLEALIGVAQWLESLLGRQLEGQVYRAGTFPNSDG